MKKNTIICFSFIVLCRAIAITQVSIPANAGALSDYVGWNAAQAFPLQIRHNATGQPITFFTSNGTPTERMRLTPTGELGVGTSTPSSLLHLTSTSSGNLIRTDGAAGNINRWQLFTGGVEKFRLSVPAGSSNVYLRTANLSTTESSNFLIQTGGTLNRLKINGVYGATGFPQYGLGQFPPSSINTSGYMLLSENPSSSLFNDNSGAWSMLHLNGSSASPNSNAYRKWMKTGITYTESGDMSYVGYRVLNPDKTEMTVAWSNDVFSQYGPDDMVFRFLSFASATEYDSVSVDNSLTSDLDGLHIARFTPKGNMGIGPNFGWQANGSYNDATERLDADGNARLRKLPTALYQADSSVTKIVMVDSLGVLRWAYSVPGQFGVPCDDSINGKLFSDTKEDLNNHNFYFTKNDSLGVNHFGVGYACGDNLPGKISSLQTHPSIISLPGTQTFAGHFHNIDSSSSFKTIFTGVYGEANGQNMLDGAINFGGYFKADSARQSVGVAGISTGGAYSVGVYGEASGGTYVDYAGYFNGDVFTTGMYLPSDQNLKQNIQEFSSSNDILSQLHLVSYDFKVLEYPQLHLQSGQQIGFISQELEQVLPGAVKESRTRDVRDENGEILFPEVSFKAVAYEKLIPILVGGHQAQSNEISQLQLSNDSLRTQNQNLQQQISDLNNRFSQLESCLQAMLPGLCEIHHGMIQQNSTVKQEQFISSINVRLSDKNTIILSQNVPNPFAESTVINYSIPATVGKAQIHFYDGQGKLINSVEITNRGAGQLNVFGEDLSSGTYTYTLVADGQIVSTKKMVKE